MDYNNLVRVSAAIGEVLKDKGYYGIVMGIVSSIEACKEGQCVSPVYTRYANAKNSKSVIMEQELDDISFVATAALRYDGDLIDAFTKYIETENDIKQLSRIYMLIRLYIR